MPNPLRFFRVLEIVIPGFFGAIGVALLVAGSLAGVFLIAFAVLAVALFEWRLRSHRRNTARVRAGLEEIARAFDAPASVQERGPGERLESISANRNWAAMIARRSSRMFIRGRWDGRDVEVGTAIVAARDFDQIISYACIPEPRAPGAFRAITRGMIAKIARFGSDKHPVATGDEAFDKHWIVDADEAVSRVVLDDRLRAQLVELHGAVGAMQAASVEATPVGLIVRCPGEMTPTWAAHLRDLAIAVHDRLAALP